jgi:transcription termination factor Rho
MKAVDIMEFLTEKMGKTKNNQAFIDAMKTD